MRWTVLRTLIAAVALSTIGLHAANVSVTGAEDRKQLTVMEKEIRKELITLPFYGVFDYITFEVNGHDVVLRGKVLRPTLFTSAERVVARVAGVESVENQIEVLPVSRFDDSIRRGLVKAIYGDNILNRYAAGANPWIRLLVKNGNVTLEGYVDREMDKNIARIRANQVAGSFTVTNNLVVKTT